MRNTILTTLAILASLTIPVNSCLLGVNSMYQFDKKATRVKIRNLDRYITKDIAKQVNDVSNTQCKSNQMGITAHLFAGQRYIMIHTSDDECDGGNSNGVIYNVNGSGELTAIATINDSDITCK
jgi:hypothetical protein